MKKIMKEMNKELLDIILTEMEIRNEVVCDDDSLTQEEKEELTWDIDLVRIDKKLQLKLIKAMMYGLVGHAFESFNDMNFDSRWDLTAEIFNDFVIDAYFE